MSAIEHADALQYGWCWRRVRAELGVLELPLRVGGNEQGLALEESSRESSRDGVNVDFFRIQFDF
jgi:hypothetical protein